MLTMESFVNHWLCSKAVSIGNSALHSAHTHLGIYNKKTYDSYDDEALTVTDDSKSDYFTKLWNSVIYNLFLER